MMRDDDDDDNDDNVNFDDIDDLNLDNGEYQRWFVLWNINLHYLDQTAHSPAFGQGGTALPLLSKGII